MKRKVLSHGGRGKNILKLLICVVVVGLFFLLWKIEVWSKLRVFLESRRVFTVKSIECKSQYGPCLEEDISVTRGFLGSSLLFLDTSQVSVALSRSFKNRKVYVQKVFPGTLQIVIEKRRTFVAVGKTSFKDGIFLTSQDGMVLSEVYDTALPKLFLDDTYSLPVVGGRLTDEEIVAARLLFLTYKVQGVLFGSFHKDYVEVKLEDGSLVYYGLDKDPQVLIGALQLIIARSKMENKLPKIIDLRYSNPVLRY
ncbi:MAG: hypothetical protein HYU80_02435 [Candidatus Blackburnbacteria bacterium]|nr:hypothetical protein [Candidatus Blackburnbacteria bacterium]